MWQGTMSPCWRLASCLCLHMSSLVSPFVSEVVQVDSHVCTVTIWDSQVLHKRYPNHLDITNFNKTPTDTDPIASDKTQSLSFTIKSLLFISKPLLHFDCNCHHMSLLPFICSNTRQILTCFLCTIAVGLSISHH